MPLALEFLSIFRAEVIWAVWMELSELKSEGRSLDIDDPQEFDAVLDWETIAHNLEAERADSLGDAFASVQGNIARAALERAGLLTE